MKILQVGWAHPRNTEFMQRVAQKLGHTYVLANQPQEGYDLIWSPSNWIDPDQFTNSKILFGPHFWVFPDVNHPFFTQVKPHHAKQCIFTCLSDWIIRLYGEFTPLEKSYIPFKALPFGLDIKATPKAEPEYDFLIYFKGRHPSVETFVKSIMDSIPMKYRIFSYGSYERSDYINTLQKTKAVIWIGSHESQGFALEECLATGTPILVYDVKSMKDEYNNGSFIYLNKKEALYATSAPYWDARCGMKVYSSMEFLEKLPKFVEQLSSFRPAEYIQETLTDEVCFKRMMDAFSLQTHLQVPPSVQQTPEIADLP